MGLPRELLPLEYAFGALQVNELAGRTFEEDCPSEVAARAAEELVHSVYPDLPLPPVPNATCAGEDYLAQVSLWPVPHGGLQGFFAILGGYLAVVAALAYVVLRWRLRSLAMA